MKLTIPEFVNAWEGYYEERRIERLQTLWIRTMMDSGTDDPKELYWLPGDPVVKKKTEEEFEQLRKEAKEKWTQGN